MADAKRDANRVPTLIGVSSSDGTTPIPVYVDPTTFRLYTDASATFAPAASGGLSIYRDIDLDETGINIKASAGQLYGWYLFNDSAAHRYVKLYNKATAPTVGTDTPVMTIPLPIGSGANVEYNIGITFSLGIGIGATTGVADNDTGAPDANDVVVNILYY